MNTNEPMTREQLDAIRERADSATEGRWAWQEDAVLLAWDGEEASWVLDHGAAFPEDAEFIAHAREDVPALLAEVERLRALIKDQARAWGEGYRARGADAIYTGLTGDPSATPNPYEPGQS
ncbi:hypothetical protein GKZ75_08460 [Kocuria indica]|uniref:Uncharacterized protein n=1 Tax=Kocuria marina subsp. indica TaxID=1049583 RepID=A0A6N9QZB7_9MICC|nr:hypothetical protein [Kocuria indica]NDO78254.1 hypothetical protein [Kocuria indica]